MLTCMGAAPMLIIWKALSSGHSPGVPGGAANKRDRCRGRARRGLSPSSVSHCLGNRIPVRRNRGGAMRILNGSTGRARRHLLAVVLVASCAAAVNAAAAPANAVPPPSSTSTTENLDRGLISIRSSTDDGNFVSWRQLRTDATDSAFNVYRDGKLVTPTPVTTATSYRDAGAPPGARYSVRPVVGGVEQLAASAEPGRPAADPRWRHDAQRRVVHLRRERRLGRRPGRRRLVGDRAEVGPHQRQGQLAVGLHGQRVPRRLQAQRHQAVARRPRPQHPGGRALHPVPGVRLRRRRQGRGGHQDR